MAVCPSCFAFSDDDASHCTACGADTRPRELSLVADFLEDAPAGRTSFRPATLLFVVALVPVFYLLVRWNRVEFFSGSGRYFFAIYSVPWAVAVAGFLRMIRVGYAGYSTRTVSTWTVAGGGAIAVLVIPIAARLFTQHVSSAVLMFCIGIHFTCCLIAGADVVNLIRTRTLTIPSAGGLLCLILALLYISSLLSLFL